MSPTEAHEKYTRTATALADITVCQDQKSNNRAPSPIAI